MTAGRSYVLVALDLGGVICSPEELAARLDRCAGRPAVLAVEVAQVPDPRIGAEPGATVTEARFTIDAAALRNTYAHARGYGAGYVVHTTG